MSFISLQCIPSQHYVPKYIQSLYLCENGTYEEQIKDQKVSLTDK